MTNQEEQAVEQRTRIREARFLLRSIADDANAPAEPIETELRTMSRRLQEIERGYDERIRVRTERKDKAK